MKEEMKKTKEEIKEKLQEKPKEEHEKESIFWRTSTWVSVYALSCFIAMVLQALICLCIKFNFTVNSIILADFINGSLTLPISNMGWIWCSICAVYCGADRASYCIKTSKMVSGKIDVGEPKNLRRIIIHACILFIIAIICNGFVDAEFDLNAWSSAFGSSILLYVGGMKAIKSVKYSDGKLSLNDDIEEKLEEETEEFVEKVNEIIPKKSPRQQHHHERYERPDIDIYGDLR